jgi:hypothetical protein
MLTSCFAELLCIARTSSHVKRKPNYFSLPGDFDKKIQNFDGLNQKGLVGILLSALGGFSEWRSGGLLGMRNGSLTRGSFKFDVRECLVALSCGETGPASTILILHCLIGI